MVVDDEAAIRSLLQEVIEREGYPCRVAGDAGEALSLLEQEPVDVVITDIRMPGINGIELIRRIKERHQADVIAMTGYVEDFSYDKVIASGASDFIQKPVGIKEVMVRLKRVLRERTILQERDRAQEELRRSLARLRRAIEGVVQAIALTVETRDPYTAGHQRRVADLACAIAKELGLPEHRIDGIRTAGLIHDLGKISVPAEILSKPTPLTDLEYELIKTHPKVGYEILKSIEFPWPVADMVLQHHERLDGSGYPQGIRREDILPEARILALADVVEALASHRPYRPALGMERALEEISRNRGILYDAQAVDACIHLFKKGIFSFNRLQPTAIHLPSGPPLL
jgi:putative nucleotidyltransferase with HDIG domain